MRRVVVAVAVVAAVAAAPAASAPKAPRDYAAIALNVLPPGESGGLNPSKSSADQIPLYDGLTARFGGVSMRDLRRYFKPERFGLGGERPRRIERPRPGVRILRDRWDVPHVYSRTRAGVEFGAGWATAEDRGLLMNLLRGPGRLAAIDAPGVDAFGLVGSGTDFAPSGQTEAALAAQVRLVAGTARGRQMLRDVGAYVAGINAYNRSNRVSVPAWTRNDVAAVAALIGAVFGKGGGDEARRSEFLDALIGKLGPKEGLQAWDDLTEFDDPETAVTVPRSFPYGSPVTARIGQVLDDGSFVPAGPSPAPARTFRMSNAILVAASRSTNHHPLFVAGPQVGYYYPEILMEEDLHGGGIDARGAAFPGVSLYVLLGRGKDYAWSATSAESDNVDQFVETLCGGDDHHYVYKGSCRSMDRFDAGSLRSSSGSTPVVFWTTVHGPVIGYGTVQGQRVAISLDRSTRGRELLNARAFMDLNTNRVQSARGFIRAMSQVEFTFNWFYADNRDIAVYSSGRLPIRNPDVDPRLPMRGTGEDDWRGFLPTSQHVQAIDPPSGAIVNWNNKPGASFGAADDNWAYGPVQRVELLEHGIAAQKRHTLATVVTAMNRAATQDIRAVELVPLIARVLERVPAPSERDALAAKLLSVWSAAGGSRLDRDLDGKIDDPGAAIMDAAWPRLADAVMRPVLGGLTDQLAQLEPRDDPANPGGSSYFAGWYGYADKDLRALLGEPVTRPFHLRYCGGGDAQACAQALWAAIDAAANELAAAQGPDPNAWRADARPERIRFAGFLPLTMRWANRPTFQQIVTFTRHRPR